MARKRKWTDRLLKRAVRTDRIEVWDYVEVPATGKHHRSTRAVVSDPALIAAFFSAIDIDEASSTGRCICLGSPHIDLFEADELIAALSFHHGVRLRWNRHWPADAELTRLSAFDLCEWFQQRGIAEPMAELRRQVDRSMAWQRRAAQVRAILPGPLAERFLRIKDRKDVVAAFLTAPAEPATKATWCLRVLGCDNASWELVDHLTHAAELATEILPILGRPACGRALEEAVRDDVDLDACFGAARVLFYFGGWENFSRVSLNAALPALIETSLRHPRRRNRQYVMWALSKLDGGDEPLRWILRGESTPFELETGELPEPEGYVFARSLGADEPLDASDRAYAAWRLARMGVSDVRRTVEKLANLASGMDRRTLQRALSAMGD